MSHRRALPAGPLRRVCPACSRRWTQVIAPDCPICDGDGYLGLGPGALRRYPAEVVSRAIEYALELQAAEDMRARIVNLDNARDNLATMVAQSRKAGLIAPRRTDPTVDAPPPTSHRTMTPGEIATSARVLASQVTGLPDDPTAALRLTAPPVTYDPTAIPVDGARPGFSVAGYVCFTALACDSIQALSDKPGNNHPSDIRVGDMLGEQMYRRG